MAYQFRYPIMCNQSFLLYRKTPDARLIWKAFYQVEDPTAQCYALCADNRNIGIFAISPALGFDAIILCFLICGLYRSYKLLGSTVSLTQLIIRDGILYFAVICATNAAWLVANIISDVSLGIFCHSSCVDVAFIRRLCNLDY